MNDYPKTAIRYQCSDGILFSVEADALNHELFLSRLQRANNCLTQGESLYVCLKHLSRGRPNEDFKRVTRRSLLTIPHLQCTKEPIYRVVKFLDAETVEVESAKPIAFGGSYRTDLGLTSVLAASMNPKSILNPVDWSHKPKKEKEA